MQNKDGKGSENKDQKAKADGKGNGKEKAEGKEKSDLHPVFRDDDKDQAQLSVSVYGWHQLGSASEGDLQKGLTEPM